MVDSVLSKLLAADSDLEAQEAKLIAQLEALQAQRSSLKAVLEIFEPDKIAAAVSPPEETEEAKPSQIAEVSVAPPTVKPEKAASKRRAKATKDKPTQPRKPSKRANAGRRGWQKYMRDEYLQTPLPEIVAGILKAQPKKKFEIAEVVSTIVEAEIPAADRKGARNRISNILAEGARKKQWLRPKPGYYRFSK